MSQTLGQALDADFVNLVATLGLKKGRDYLFQNVGAELAEYAETLITKTVHSFSVATVWGLRIKIAEFLPIVYTTEDYAYRKTNKGASPGAPGGGTTTENHTPTGWSRARSNPTSAQEVWRIKRVESYSAGAFVSATLWGGIERIDEYTQDFDYAYRKDTEFPVAPAGGGSTENHTPTGWDRARVDGTATESVYAVRRTRNFSNLGAFQNATAWEMVGLIETNRPQLNTDTDYLFAKIDPKYSATPSAPNDGEDIEEHATDIWTRVRPDVTAGSREEVYLISRRRTFANAVFESATAWDGVTKITQPLEDQGFLYRKKFAVPSIPAGGTNTEDHVPANWGKAVADAIIGEPAYRIQRTRTFVDTVSNVEPVAAAVNHKLISNGEKKLRVGANLWFKSTATGTNIAVTQA